MSVSHERLTALAATIVAVLIAAVFQHFGADKGDMIGAAFLAYLMTVIGVAVRVNVNPFTVVRATSKGLIVTAVVVALLLTSFGRSLAAVVS